MSTYDIAVIGIGMIGSAALRYLSAAGFNCIGIGPGEPEDWSSHAGAFSSHYDQGRITRITDPDYVWGLLAKRSIAAYQEIESRSGIRFHYKAGQLRVSPDPGEPGDTLDQSARNGELLGATFTRMDRAALSSHFPSLHFPPGAAGIYETGDAGFVNPRSLVAAQLAIAGQQGARILRDEASSLAAENGAHEILTGAHGRVRATRVLVACGGYTNHVLGKKLDLQMRPRTALMAELSAAECARIGDVPTLIWRLKDHEFFKSFYSTPPTRYPDGRMCFKIGGEHRVSPQLRERGEFSAWFRSPGDRHEIEQLKRVLLSALPGLNVDGWQSKPCVTTYTAHGRPYVDELEKNLFVATGGCGAAAKSSNEIGRLASLLIEDKPWPQEISRQSFGVKTI